MTETRSPPASMTRRRRCLGERALHPGLDARRPEVVQEVLGLVLEAEDLHARARLDVGQRHALDPVGRRDRVAVRAGLRVADRGEHPLLEDGRHRVLQALGLLVHLVPRDPEDVGEEALDQPVAAHDALGVLAARVGEVDRLVGGAGDVAVALEPADHLVHGRRGELHGARDVGARHRRARPQCSQNRVWRYSSSATVACSAVMRSTLPRWGSIAPGAPRAPAPARSSPAPRAASAELSPSASPPAARRSACLRARTDELEALADALPGDARRPRRRRRRRPRVGRGRRRAVRRAGRGASTCSSPTPA